MTEVYELLAHGYMQAGELEKARDYYLKLTQLEPENQLHARNYQQVAGRLGTPSSSHLITPEEGAVMVDELEATAPFIDQRYSDEVALFVRAALTDAELFISYNMPAKALGPLLSALPQAPRDLRVNQRLGGSAHHEPPDLPRLRFAAALWRASITTPDHPDEATRYGELAAKYEERGSTGPAELGVPTIVHVEPTQQSWRLRLRSRMPSSKRRLRADAARRSRGRCRCMPEPIFPCANAACGPRSCTEPTEFEIQSAAHGERNRPLGGVGRIGFGRTGGPGCSAREAVEVAAASEEESAADPEAIKEAVEEVRFYLSNGMHEEARAAYAKLERLKPEAVFVDGSAGGD